MDHYIQTALWVGFGHYGRYKIAAHVYKTLQLPLNGLYGIRDVR